jgi:hypothetical protein
MENLQALTNGRAGQCYRIALAIIEVGSDALVLVHGRVAGFEHAWISLEDGRRIYDPVAHALIDSANYPAVIDHRHTKAEALAMATKFQTCGPW